MKASYHLNYKGELSDQLGVTMGPNTFGERFVVVEQTYDVNINKTRLGLAFENVYLQELADER